jgi:hypothetical protein
MTAGIDVDTLFALVKAGKTDREIAEQLGVRRTDVKDTRHQYALKPGRLSERGAQTQAGMAAAKAKRTARAHQHP